MEQTVLKGIFFCDVDGTLLPYGNKSLSTELMELIHQITKEGYLVCISSGRPYLALLELFWEVRDEVAFSCCNGSALFYKEKPLADEVFLQRSVVEGMYDDCLARGCQAIIATSKRIYLSPRKETSSGKKHYVGKPYAQSIESLAEVAQEAHQITICCNENLGETLSYFKDTWADKVHIAVSGHAMFDLSASNKGIALKRVASCFSLPLDRTFAFGDSENDLSMLRLAGKAFVMESSCEALRNEIPDHCQDVGETIRSIVFS
ncbi:HAD-IIB family hydrolase [uncultured Sphaerochaeta sp.]|uniref:HAD-IIB family hydrolase n=1 Tax=uncultured Sphaerochaeta sp. TaxID=886478 RepID=UPI002A0A497A|nr:HAD-IIB family hydrolase [uncultured Sphaerochaeta sp.]